jgi:protein CpxP
MMMRVFKISLLAFSLCVGSTSALHAQAPASPPPSTPVPADPQVAAKPSPTQIAVEQRIAALQTKMAITPDQQPAWAVFAQVMRDNAANTDTLFQQRAQSASTMSALDNMKSYAAIARAYAENTQHLADAFETLYGKLSQPQQQIADTLFRQPAATSVRRR